MRNPDLKLEDTKNDDDSIASDLSIIPIHAGKRINWCGGRSCSHRRAVPCPFNPGRYTYDKYAEQDNAGGIGLKKMQQVT